MPRYLRWIAAVTTAVTVQFAFFIAVGAVALGTGNKKLSGGVGLLVTLGSTLIPVLGALGVNDGLRTRYPAPPRMPASPAGDSRSVAPAPR